MAPVKKPQPSTGRGRKPTTKSSSSSSSSTSSKFKPKSRSKDVKRPPPKQVKTKPVSATTGSKKPKKPQYTESQLKLPAVNSIVPANATIKSGRGTGKKRNKIYVDDTESMMTILAMVNAEKEGQIESKVLKARQLEEIREARLKEAEKRREGKREVVEEVKRGLKRKGVDAKDKQGEKEKGRGRGRVNGHMANGVEDGGVEKKDHTRKKRKSVSFA